VFVDEFLYFVKPPPHVRRGLRAGCRDVLDATNNPARSSPSLTLDCPDVGRHVKAQSLRGCGLKAGSSFVAG